MKWNEEKQMIIGTMSPHDTEKIQAEENLLGFFFDMGEMEDQPTTRPISNFQPHDEDSISTLKSNDKTVRSVAASRNQPTTINSSKSPLPSTIPSSNDSVNQGSVMTMESYQQLDTRITGLSSQLVAHQHKNNAQFESIM